MLGHLSKNSETSSKTTPLGGGGRIRTYEDLAALTVFKTAAFNRSATPPAVFRRRGHPGCSRILTTVKRLVEVGL